MYSVHTYLYVFAYFNYFLLYLVNINNNKVVTVMAITNRTVLLRPSSLEGNLP